MTRLFFVVLLILSGCIFGCVTIDKEAVSKLTDIAADGAMNVRDPEMSFLWRTDIGLVLKLEGVDGKGKVTGRMNPITQSE